MTEYRLKTGKVGKGVVKGYKKIESGVVKGYKKIEKSFVECFLERVEEDENGNPTTKK